MTELEDLEEIAETHAFGFRSFTCDGIPRQGRRMPNPECKEGHPREGNTSFRKNGRRVRRVCRICERARYRRGKRKQSSEQSSGNAPSNAGA